MTIDVDAVYEDGVLKPERPLALKEKAKVHVTIEAKAEEVPAEDDDPTGWKTARELIGSITEELAVSDASVNHDRYIGAIGDLRRYRFLLRASAIDEKERHRQARELLETLQGRTLSEVLGTTNLIVFETLTLIQTTVTRNAHARAVRVGEQLYSAKLARIYRTTFEDQLEAFAYLRQHKDKDYSAVDCLSFVVMLKLGIQEAWTFDEHFSHRFIARPDPLRKR